MASDGDKRRLNLFRKYAKNLELWRPARKGMYVCPLCMTRGFNESAVYGPNPPLTDEHGLQKGLGNPCHILTCAECNNVAGTKIDADLHKRLHFSSFCEADQTKPLKNIRMNVSGENLGIEIIRAGGDNPKTDIKIIAEQSDERAIERVKNAMKSNPLAPMELSFGKRVMPNVRRARVALLKSAYLLAFRYFGYGYLLSHVMEPIRATIRDPDDPKVPIDDIVLGTSIDRLPATVALVTEPDELNAIAVPLPIQEYKKGHLVILPTGENTYEKWAEWRQKNADPDKLKLKMKVFPDDESYLDSCAMGFGAPGRQE